MHQLKAALADYRRATAEWLLAWLHVATFTIAAVAIIALLYNWR